MSARLKIEVIGLAACLGAMCCGCAANSPASEPDTEGFVEFTADPQSSYTPEGVTTTLNIQDFKVTAIYKGEWNNTFVLLDNVIVERTSLNTWEYNPPIRWPQFPVNFYMVSPASENWEPQKWGDGGARIYSYTNDGKVDLLAAQDLQAIGQYGAVHVNFRHALAHVAAAMRVNVPADYKLIVKAIYFSCLPREGHYEWPSEDTDDDTFEIGTPEASGYWREVHKVSPNNYQFLISGSLDKDYEGVEMPATDDFKTMHSLVQFSIPWKIDPPEDLNWGAWKGEAVIVAYRILRRSDNAVVYPNAGTPLKYQFTGDRTWAMKPFFFYGVTPGNTTKPGLSYLYRFTLTYPSADTRADSPASDITCTVSPY